MYNGGGDSAKYVSTVRGSPEGSDGPSSSPLYRTAFSSDAVITMPLTLKLLSVPKMIDASNGKSIKPDAVLHGLEVTVIETNVAESTSSASQSTSSGMASLPTDVLSHIQLVLSTVQSLSSRVKSLEDEVRQLKAERPSDSMDGLHLVFVYGTLKRGYFNYNHYLHPTSPTYPGKAQFVSTAITKNRMKLCVGDHGIPYLHDDSSPPSHFVEGELFLVDDEKLKHLDALEGVEAEGDWYECRSLPVVDSDGRNRVATAYISVGERGMVGIDKPTSSYLKSIHDDLYVCKAERGENV